MHYAYTVYSDILVNHVDYVAKQLSLVCLLYSHTKLSTASFSKEHDKNEQKQSLIQCQ